VPATALAVTVEAINFPVGDSNYPINPTLRVVNHGAKALPGGSVLEFDLPTSAPAQVTTWSGETIQVLSVGHSGSNVGGLKGDFNRVAIALPSWKTLNQGDVWDISLVYYLPVSGPANYTVTVAGVRYALTQEHPGLQLAP
jgi:chitinase